MAGMPRLVSALCSGLTHRLSAPGERAARACHSQSTPHYLPAWPGPILLRPCGAAGIANHIHPPRFQVLTQCFKSSAPQNRKQALAAPARDREPTRPSSHCSRVATAAVVRPHEGRPQGRAAPGAGHCRAARVGGRRGSPRASPAPRLCASPPALARPAGCLQTAAGFGARKRSAAGRLATALPQQSKTGRGGRLGEGDGPWQIRRLARRSLLSESPSSLSLPLPLRVDPYNP